MSTFDDALEFWTIQINEWYDINATDDEVREAFEKDYRHKLAYDDTSYVEMFFKSQDGGWSRWLDTSDREGLADSVEYYRGNDPLPTYADLGGNLLNKAPAFVKQ